MEQENIQGQNMESVEKEQETQQDAAAENVVPADTDGKPANNAGEETAAQGEDNETRLMEKLAALNDSHLRLMADFDNYKKKTLKERAELIKYGGEGIIKNLLPIIDDFERALAAMPEGEDAVKDGVVLIHGKFLKFLQQSGVKEIATVGEVFDTDFHEAVTMFPAADESQKGKIIDCVQKGYTFHDKVIRYAKVVVAQ